MKKTCILLVPLLFCTYAFAPGRKTAACYARFKTWYQAHHEELRTQQTAGGLVFSLTFQPAEVSVLREISDRVQISRKELRALYAPYADNLQFNFRIENPAARDFLLSQSVDEADYTDKLYYLIGNIQQDFSIVHAQDTLRPLSCHFENNYGTAPFILLHLVFPRPSDALSAPTQLLYADHLFGADTLLFDLQPFSRLPIPKIK